jgi:polysaccharide deacetylase 2 family uncharacterized protein YibQ
LPFLPEKHCHGAAGAGLLRHLLLVLLALPMLVNAQPRIAIIIDDLGYHRARGVAITDLPAAVTCAVIPQAPWSPLLAERAKQYGKEVILHMPMETDSARPLDKGGLNERMDRLAYARVVREAFERIPQARGLNNHMGSTLTARQRPMDWLMDELKRRDLYFLDSRTTPDSVAETVARERGLPTLGRDIFLDNNRDPLSINSQFNKLIAIARKRGSAIGIGHPYPETLSYLKKVLPLLEDAGVTVVPVSELLPTTGLDTQLARGPEENRSPHGAAE